MRGGGNNRVRPLGPRPAVSRPAGPSRHPAAAAAAVQPVVDLAPDSIQNFATLVIHLPRPCDPTMTNAAFFELIGARNHTDVLLKITALVSAHVHAALGIPGAVYDPNRSLGFDMAKYWASKDKCGYVVKATVPIGLHMAAVSTAFQPRNSQDTDHFAPLRIRGFDGTQLFARLSIGSSPAGASSVHRLRLVGMPSNQLTSTTAITQTLVSALAHKYRAAASSFTVYVCSAPCVH